MLDENSHVQGVGLAPGSRGLLKGNPHILLQLKKQQGNFHKTSGHERHGGSLLPPFTLR